MVALVNPFRPFRCPYCDGLYYPGNCAVVASAPKGEVLQAARSGFLARTFVPPLNGPKYVRKQARRQCPHCGNLLFRNVETVEKHTIAVVGDVASGKSHYIASCINQLKQRSAWQVIGCSRIVGQGDTDREYFRKYYEPVYGRLEQIDTTLAATSHIIEPLVYEIVFPEKSPLSPARSVNLLFYDSSGEDIRQQDRLVLYSHFILDASAIIFLADPLAMPGIVKQLPQSMRSLANAPARQKTYDVLNRVIQTFEENKRLKPGAKLKTPIAITLSKSDLLKFVTKSKPYLFLSDAAYGNRLNTLLFDRINEEVQTFLQGVGDQELLPSSESFENKCFFAISPTGWSSDGAGKFPSIEPLRCLDPLLWALWKLDVIR